MELYIKEAGALGTFQEEVEQTRRVIGTLDSALLTLRLSFGKLGAAVERALAPAASVVVPALNQTIRGLTALANDAAAVMAALFGTVRKQTQKVSAVTGSAVKRTVAGFDRLERLNGRSGGGAVWKTVVEEAEALSPRLQAVVNTIQSLLEPIRNIDFTPAEMAFQRLKTAIEPLKQSLFAGLSWAWHNLLVPLAAWTVEDALPAFLQAVAAGLDTLNAIVTALKPVGVWLWEEFLKPLGAWAAQTFITALENIRQNFQAIGAWIGENEELIQNAAMLALRLGAAWLSVKTAGDLVGGLGSSVGATLSALLTGTSNASTGIHALITALTLLSVNWRAVGEGLKAGFQGFGEGARSLFDSVVSAIKNGCNRVIAFVNQLLGSLTQGLNAMFSALNTLKVTLPGWLPLIGGKSLGFNLPRVTAPQIPYLAQGAVLPANKPFLAMVGDQKHGTNIEAPLATIQEAVAAVMGDFVDSNMAGHEATVVVLKDILEAVLGISVGDDVIGRAVSRYQRKRAVMKGGAL